MAVGPGMTERAGAFFREHSLSMDRNIDVYLSEHIYELMERHNLATTKEIADVDKDITSMESTLDDIEGWTDEFETKRKAVEKRIGKLEKKHGVGG